MKHHFLTACAVILLLAALLLILPFGPEPEAPDSAAARNPAPAASAGEFNEHCTVFYAADGEAALGGNNEDSVNPRTKIWFLPGDEQMHGVAIVGYEDYHPQGGVNDHGVFFDGLAVKVVQVPKEIGKPIYPGGAAALMIRALQECETVDCVLKLFDRHSRGPGTWNGQYLVGDGKGNSAIVEPLTVIRKQGAYQVATNFFQSEPQPEGRYDYRYRAAVSMLEKGEPLSVDLFRRILDATHQEGQGHTLYSTIYDLKRGLIYLYFFHDFDRVAVLDIRQELLKGVHEYDIPSLFPPSEQAIAFGRATSNGIAQLQAKQLREPVDADLLARFAGQYEFQGQDYISIRIEGDKLFAKSALIPWVELYPESGTCFFRPVSDGDGNVGQIRVTFLVDTSGRIKGLEYTDARGNRLNASKSGAGALSNARSSAFAALLLLVPIGWYALRRWKKQTARSSIVSQGR